MPRANPSKNPDEQPEIVDIAALVGDLNDDGTHKEPLIVPGARTTPAPAPESMADMVKDADARLTEADALRARVKHLENQIAVDGGRKDPVQELEVPPNGGENIVIHIVENGFTALGQIWFRGQELEFDPSGKAYADTRDKYGRSWLDLRGDESGQIERYGEVKFRAGPWTGRSYTDAAGAGLEYPLKPIREGDPPVLPPTQAELHAAASMEAKRLRAAPRLPVR